MLNAWQYAKGYVRISVSGFGLERFMNMAAFRGVYLWDACRTPYGAELNVSIAGFKRLKNCARKTKCRVKIIEKNGLPFLLHRYRKRKLMMGGVLFFALGLFVLSSFVWRIDIEGNERLVSETVSVFLEAQGLRVGAPKFRLSDRALEHALLTHFSDISWADVETRGTRTTVRLTETLPPQPVLNRQTPAHVVASADGVITRVATWGGAPMVAAGDVVQAGQLLVSGVVDLEPDTPGTPVLYVHAYAEVWARRFYPMEFAVPFTYSKKIFTGQTAKSRAFRLLFLRNAHINAPGGSHSFTTYDKITTHHQPGVSGRYPLPVVLSVTHFYETAYETLTRTPDEAKALAQQMIIGRIIREFDFAADVAEIRVDFHQTADALLVRGVIVTNERIDRQVAITTE